MSYWAELMLLWSGQALVLIGVLSVAAIALRKRSAGERYAVWLAGLLVITVLPAANVFMRSFASPLPVTQPVRQLTRLPAEPVASPALEPKTSPSLIAMSRVEPQEAVTSWRPVAMTA